MVQADLESELVFDSSLLRHNILAAPDPRGRMRMAKFFAEEVRHGYTFWRIAKGLGVELTGRYFREAKRKRQEAFDHIGAVSDWTELAIVNTLTDRMGVFVFKDMTDCSYRPWAEVSLDVARDEVGHTALGYANLREPIHKRGQLEAAQRYLEKWYPMTLDMFGRSDSARQWRYVAWGIKRSGNEELRRNYVAEVEPAARAARVWSRPTTSTTATSSDGETALMTDHVRWSDLEGLVDALRAANPRVDPRALDDDQVQDLVDGLDGFERPGAPGPGRLRSPAGHVALGRLRDGPLVLDDAGPRRGLDPGRALRARHRRLGRPRPRSHPPPPRRPDLRRSRRRRLQRLEVALRPPGTDIDSAPAEQPAAEALALAVAVTDWTGLMAALFTVGRAQSLLFADLARPATKPAGPSTGPPRLAGHAALAYLELRRGTFVDRAGASAALQVALPAARALLDGVGLSPRLDAAISPLLESLTGYWIAARSRVRGRRPGGPSTGARRPARRSRGWRESSTPRDSLRRAARGRSRRWRR